MNKQYCVVSCPIDTYSGYGARSRDFVKALYELKKDEWNIQIIPQRWGSTPWNYIDDNKTDWGWLEPMLNQTGQITQQPDVWIQITVPNEFQPIGKYNLGLTAGIETTICDPSWIDGVNRMNLTLVSSDHAKKVFESTCFEERDKNTNQVVRQLKLEKPVEVLFEGVNVEKFFSIEESKLQKTKLVKSISDIKEAFCYLFVGHWLQGEIGEDRKNVGLLIHTFLDTFKDKKTRPALILKTSGAGCSIMDRDTMLEKIDGIRNSIDSKDLPSIYLLHGEVEDDEMNNLYNHPKVKAMINLTKGEGFGRPLLEFAMAKKPIIVSNWSGHVDFLDAEFSCLISGEVKQIHPSAVVQNILLPESSWFNPKVSEVKHYMKDVFDNYNKYTDNAKRQSHKCKTNFSFDKMKDLLSVIIERVPKKVELKLPTLKKIQLPKLKKVEA
jgi:glycosyltransferase involved in cell wall biosynthesis